MFLIKEKEEEEEEEEEKGRKSEMMGERKNMTITIKEGRKVRKKTIRLHKEKMMDGRKRERESERERERE